ncbi:MAG: flagellar hook-basal body complex protein FliE [Myxococcota bacterium]
MSISTIADSVRFPEIETPEPSIAQEPNPSISEHAPSFVERLREFAEEVNETQMEAEQVSRDFAEGKRNDIHGTMVQMQTADIEFRMLGTVRNRVLEAYREVMKMGA